MSRAPMELLVIHFPDEVPGEKLVPELNRLIDTDLIHLVDLAFVVRNADGDVSTFELNDRDGIPGYEALDGVLHTVEGLIADDDLSMIAEGVEAGHTAAVLLFENVWASRFAEIVREAGGELAYSQRIPPPVVDAIASAE
jgi:hypothetical protein